MRAGLVSSAKEWEWSSHGERIGNKKRKLVDDPPIEMPVEWDKYVDGPLTEKELERLWQSVNRQSPFGDIIWQQKVCKAHGLESTIRPVGRPKKNEEGKKK